MWTSAIVQGQLKWKDSDTETSGERAVVLRTEKPAYIKMSLRRRQVEEAN